MSFRFPGWELRFGALSLAAAFALAGCRQFAAPIPEASLAQAEKSASNAPDETPDESAAADSDAPSAGAPDGSPPDAADAPDAEPTPTPSVREGAASKSASDRALAARNWPDDGTEPLPLLHGLADDPDPRVRAAALNSLARCDQPEALARSLRALDDHDLEVRLAAYSALGQMTGDRADPAVAELLRRAKNQPERLRGAALAALAELDQTEIVLAAQQDDAWMVRKEIAKSLPIAWGAASRTAASQLVADRHAAVAQAMLENARTWPAEEAGPILLAGLASPAFLVRDRASRLLAEIWPPAADFPVQAAGEVRKAKLAILRERWEQEHPRRADEVASSARPATKALSPEAQQQVAALLAEVAGGEVSAERLVAIRAELKALGGELAPALAQWSRERQAPLPAFVYDAVLPDVDRQFAELSRLQSTRVDERRLASLELARLASPTPLGELAAARLAELIVPESDPLVWRGVQQAFTADSREPAVRTAYAALGHADVEVRRRGCEYLERNGSPAHMASLVAALDDANSNVVLAAARALGSCGKMENPLPLVRLLASRDSALVFAAARSLGSLGSTAGSEAVIRLAHDRDPQIRRAAAETMGELGRQEFAPTLILMLDDQLGVQRAALRSLASITGEDVGQQPGESSVPHAEQIARWKRWYAKNPVRAASKK